MKRLDKRLIYIEVYMNDKKYKEYTQKYTVYSDKNGEFVNSMGKKFYLINNSIRTDIKTIQTTKLT